jgi:hypothetical protein
VKPIFAFGGASLLNYFFGSDPNRTHFPDGIGLILGVALVVFIFQSLFSRK